MILDFVVPKNKIKQFFAGTPLSELSLEKPVVAYLNQEDSDGKKLRPKLLASYNRSIAGKPPLRPSKVSKFTTHDMYRSHQRIYDTTINSAKNARSYKVNIYKVLPTASPDDDEEEEEDDDEEEVVHAPVIPEKRPLGTGNPNTKKKAKP